MATKLSKKIIAIALLGIFGLAGCDEVTAYPKNVDDPVLQPTADNNKDIYNNELKSIYEKIREGSLASDVLDKLLYEYANSMFGRYSSSSPTYLADKEGEQFLREVAAGSDEEKDAFIASHKAYWPGEEAPTSAEDKALARAKLDAIAKSIYGRIQEALYNKISGGAYSKHNIFSEIDFLASLYFDGKSVTKFTEVQDEDPTAANYAYKGIITPEVKGKEVFESGILHEKFYMDADNSYAIEENIVSIYKELLTEQYIIDESYSTLGRSFARKVNVLSVTVDSDNKADVPALVNWVLENYIAKKDGDNYRFEGNDEEAVQELYGSVSNIMRGLPKYFRDGDDEFDQTAKDIVDGLYTTYGLYGDTTALTGLGSNTFLTSTEYGSLMKQYNKIDEDLSLTDSSIESSFNGGGAYSIEQGKIYKETDIELKKYTTSGWYIKNGGLTSLPDSIRNRLFNISVANALDVTGDDALVDRLDSTWSYDEENDISRYVAKVNGAYFLKAQTVEDKNSNKDLYFYESSSNTYYFVQIAEAVNPAKLSDGDNSYAKLYNAQHQQDIATEVCEIVGEISSYGTLAKEHWLEKMTLEYHDQVVYDYFKDNYPDLFE